MRFYPPNSRKNQNFWKMKKMPTDIISHMCTKIMVTWCTVPEIRCATDGRTDGRKKWHIKVDPPPKNKAESKMENPTHNLQRRTLCFSFKNCESKVKVWWMSWSSRKKKKRAFFVPLIFITFVFYHNVLCIEQTFWIYVLLHIKNHYFIHFFACVQNCRKPSVYS